MEYKFTTDNFETEVLQAELPEEYEGKLKVGKCNVDENMQLAQKYRISSIPAFMVFKNGEAAATCVGAMSATELKAKLEQVM